MNGKMLSRRQLPTHASMERVLNDDDDASRVKKFYSQPFRHWPVTISACKVHAEGKKKKRKSSNELYQSLHSKTWPILSNIMAHLKGSGEEIEVMLTKSSDKEVQKNRNKLKPIVDTVILLGRLGLPFRGHRDDSQYHPNVGEYSSGGVGNFIECLGYRVRGGDTELENHLKTCSKNASYISKTSQNELIFCCGKFIRDALIKDIKESKFFSILADEASDCSNQEQLSFVLRFVDKDGEIREEFLGFLHCELGLSGKALAETILTEVGNLTLDINNCRGQGA